MLISAFWSECRDSNSKQYGATHRLLLAVIVIQEASSSFLHTKRKKTVTADAVTVFLVRVSRFELEAS